MVVVCDARGVLQRSAGLQFAPLAFSVCQDISFLASRSTGCNGDLTMLERHCWFCSWLQSGATCPMWVAVSGRRQVGVPDGVGDVLAGIGRQRLLGMVAKRELRKAE